MDKSGKFLTIALILLCSNSIYADDITVENINLGDEMLSYEEQITEEKIDMSKEPSSVPDENTVNTYKNDKESEESAAALIIPDNNKETNSFEKKEYQKKIAKKTITVEKNKNNLKTKKAAKYYAVKKGDTIYKICKQFKISEKQLLTINSLKKKTLYVGQVLKVTSGNPTITSTKTPASTKKTSASVKNVLPKNDYKGAKPAFSWPIKTVKNVKSDACDGVKPIGIIITGKPGSDVISSADGIVKKVGYIRGYGNYVIIGHPNRFMTIYSNLDDIFVKENQAVNKGELVGKLENSNTHLHFQISYAGKPQNAASYLPIKR